MLLMKDFLIIRREYLDEMRQLIFKIVQHEFRDGAACIGIMPLDHVFQFGGVVFVDGIQLDHLPVAKDGELAADPGPCG